jgi:peptidoglycan/LPS O-acetylase OafA/YrhL
MLAGLCAFALVLLATGRDASHYPFSELPLQLLLVQNWGLTHALAWNDPAWSISTEFGAYLVFPFLVLVLPWQRLRLPALLALVALLCGALYLLFAANGETSLGAAIPTLGLWRCLAEFALGMVLCRLWQELHLHRGIALAGMAAGCAAMVAGLLAGWPETVFVPAAFAALLLALALDKGPIARLLASGPLRGLGDVSYSTYLAHFPLFILYKLLFVDDTLQLGWAGVAGFLALVLACSLLLYRMLEKPAHRWLNAHPPALAARATSAS